jgi:hypothetical protein
VELEVDGLAALVELLEEAESVPTASRMPPGGTISSSSGSKMCTPVTSTSRSPGEAATSITVLPRSCRIRPRLARGRSFIHSP